MSMLLNFAKKRFSFFTIYDLFKVIFSRLDRVFVRNSLLCSKLLLYAARKVFFDKNSIIWELFGRKSPISKV